MGKLEANNCLWQDQTVLAHLAIKTDVEPKGAQAVIAVGHANERAEHVRALIGWNRVEIESRLVVEEVNVTITSGGWCINGSWRPFAGRGLWKDRSAALVSQVESLLVAYQTVIAPNDAQHAAGVRVNDGFFLRHGQAPFTAFFLDTDKHWLLFGLKTSRHRAW